MSEAEVIQWVEFPPVLSQEETVSKAIGLLQEGNDIIIVVDENEKYLGLIRTRDIVGKGVNPASLCKSYVDRRVPALLENSSYDPVTLGEMMINSGSRFIPIVSKNNSVRGAIKDLMILSKLQKTPLMQTLDKITNAVNWDLIYLNQDETVGNALVNLRSHGFSRIPVFGSNKEIMGIIKDRSFLKTQQEKSATVGDKTGNRDKDWQLLPAKDFLVPTEILDENIQIDEIIKQFISQGESSFFIQGKNEDYGIITPLDIIRLALTEASPDEFNINVMQAPDDSIKAHTIRKGNSIIKRNKSWLGSQCDLTVRFKRNLSQSKRGQFSITVTTRLNSSSGKKYNSEATDFGAEKTVNRTLDNLSRIISDDRRRILTKRDKSKTYRKRTDLD